MLHTVFFTLHISRGEKAWFWGWWRWRCVLKKTTGWTLNMTQIVHSKRSILSMAEWMRRTKYLSLTFTLKTWCQASTNQEHKSMQIQTDVKIESSLNDIKSPSVAKICKNAKIFSTNIPQFFSSFGRIKKNHFINIISAHTVPELFYNQWNLIYHRRSI